MKIPFAKPVFLGKEKEYLSDAFSSGWVSDGPYVERFEKEFLRYFEGGCGLTVSSGTTALHLALLGLGIGPGDEVIVPGYTFAAPVNMVMAVGATPVYADVDPLTWLLSPACVEKCITSRTRAIIAVHIYGNVCNMPALRQIAERHKLFLIEDAAQAAFSRHGGKYAGNFGDVGCFSFQATKTICMGEGGFVLAKDKRLSERMRIIRDHGMNKEKRYWHETVGYNFRLTNLQAAVGCAQLECLEDILARKEKLRQFYEDHLKNQDGVTLQRTGDAARPVMWCTAVKADGEVFRKDRDQIMGSLATAGIETRPGFYGFHRLPPYKDNAPRLPVAGTLGEEIILLPCDISLQEDAVVMICDELKKLRAQAALKAS